jgi:hypothetical protein
MPAHLHRPQRDHRSRRPALAKHLDRHRSASSSAVDRRSRSSRTAGQLRGPCPPRQQRHVLVRRPGPRNRATRTSPRSLSNHHGANEEGLFDCPTCGHCAQLGAQPSPAGKSSGGRYTGRSSATRPRKVPKVCGYSRFASAVLVGKLVKIQLPHRGQYSVRLLVSRHRAAGRVRPDLPH